MAGLKDILSLQHLPAMPATLARLVPMLIDPETEWHDLEQVLRQDEALTVAVLRLANSARYGSSGARFDLGHSMTRLGRGVLRNCVMAQQLSGVLRGDNAAFGLQRGELWRSSLGGAFAAEELARRHAPQDVPMAFVCGLLRDVGKLALNSKYGEGYLAAVSGHSNPERSFIDAERAALGFDHAQVGAALARQWKLPARIALCIENHHAPPASAPEHDPLFDVVHAADVICRWAGLGVGVDGMEYGLAAHVREALALNRRSAEREIVFVWDKLREADEAMNGLGKLGAMA